MASTSVGLQCALKSEPSLYVKYTGIWLGDTPVFSVKVWPLRVIGNSVFGSCVTCNRPSVFTQKSNLYSVILLK